MNLKNYFKGKNILITGGSRGIGKVVAMELAGLGANLFLTARDIQTLTNCEKEFKTKYPEVQCFISSCDITDYEKVEATVAEMIEQMGTVDGLISNAGITYSDFFEKIPMENFEEIVKVNYLGAVSCTKAVLPHLRSGSFLSYTSSVLGYMGAFGYTAYAGPKFALLGFAESLRQELKSRCVTVSVLCPPDTLTPGYEKENKTKPYETLELSKSIRSMKPEEVAKRYVKALAKGTFLITVNFESYMYYRLHGCFPETMRSIIDWMIKGYQKKKWL